MKICEILSFQHLYDPKKLIGIEIEMEGTNLGFNRSILWRFTHDGSLRNNPESIEYVLKNPSYLGQTALVLENLQNFLLHRKRTNAIFNPSDRCGVHIHFNVQHYTTKSLMKFICLYLVFENLLLRYCGGDREGNLFCLRAVDAEQMIDLLIDFKKTDNLRNLIRNHSSLKYAAINLGAIRVHGSLEFRGLRTPNNLNDIEVWIKLLNCIKVEAEKFARHVEIIEACYHYGSIDVTKKIIKDLFPILVKGEEYNIEQLIFKGIRIAQDSAYTEFEEQKEGPKRKTILHDEMLEHLHSLNHYTTEMPVSEQDQPTADDSEEVNF